LAKDGCGGREEDVAHHGEFATSTELRRSARDPIRSDRSMRKNREEEGAPTA
jgi:hypothetical protein